MIQENILLVLSLLFATSMLAMLSEKLRISYPIFLVLAGLLIGFIPGIPSISLQPDLVFLIFLPPLLYAAAWNTSWKDFWRYKRPITLLAVGLVIFTSTAVAFISHAIIPDFSLAMGFMLGGIISPPDAVAAASVLHNLKVSKRVLTILEGESLINDASSLIVFRVAMAAVFTGQFVLWKATTDFFVVAIMGIIIGLAIALIIYAVHRFFPTTPSIDTGLTLISPYLMYIVAEHFHYSGVMSVVTGGLLLSSRSHEIFSYNSRIQAYAFWETLVFLLNGLVFILIGLQLPEIVSGLGQYSIFDAVLYGIIISVATIIVRIVWIYPGAYLPRIFSKNIRTTEPRPTPQGVCIDTVRRDLEELAGDGKLIKVHGGALLHSFEHEAIDHADTDELKASVIIGKKAAALVRDNLFVLTTGGTTVTEMARALRPNIRATFISGSVPLIIEYMAHPGLEVIIIGDKVSAKTKETSGVEAVDRIRRLRADLCFIDIRAIDVAGGIMENDWDIAQLKRTMIDSSQKVIGLVTSNSLNTFLPLPVCAITQINCLITDLPPQHELLRPYVDMGIEII